MRHRRTSVAARPPEAGTSPRRRVSGPAAVVLVVGLGLAIAGAGPAHADESHAPAKRGAKMLGWYEMPFPCGQAWTGSTRSSHSPSARSIDWNRADDVDDPVVASAAGVVTRAYPKINGGYGKWVQVTHPGGESTLYAHLNSVLVSVGQTVDQGTQLGTVGSTGNSTGPHLHFEQRAGSVVARAKFEGKKFKYGTTQTSNNCVDSPLAANMLGTPAAERVVYHRGAGSVFQIRDASGAVTPVAWGVSTDDPVLGDWDGDGYANVGVRRPSESRFYLLTPGGPLGIDYGIATDRPVAGDWNGDGRDEVGVWRASAKSFYLRNADGTTTAVQLGTKSSIPVVGDWNGDAVDDLGVYDQVKARFSLRVVSGGVTWRAQVTFGMPYDLPVVGDWDGNGRTDLGVWRPSEGTFYGRQAASVREPMRRQVALRFGAPRGG